MLSRAFQLCCIRESKTSTILFLSFIRRKQQKKQRNRKVTYFTANQDTVKVDMLRALVTDLLDSIYKSERKVDDQVGLILTKRVDILFICEYTCS